MTTLTDSTVLSNFAAVGRLDLLRDALGTSHVADAVHDEIQRGIRRGHAFLAAVERHFATPTGHGWLHVVTLERPEELNVYRALPRSLHRGEAVSLAIAAHRGWTLFTDDRRARTAAHGLGVPVLGTLSVLIRHVDARSLTMDDANTLLQAMIVRAHYRSPVTDLRLLDPG